MSVVFPDFLTLKTFLFLFPLALAVVRMCSCVCTSILLRCRSPWAFAGQNLPLLQGWVPQRASAEHGELRWVQPRCLPPALISDNRIKCHSLGIFLVVVEGRWELKGKQWKKGRGERGSRQREQTTFWEQASTLPAWEAGRACFEASLSLVGIGWGLNPALAAAAVLSVRSRWEWIPTKMSSQDVGN